MRNPIIILAEPSKRLEYVCDFIFSQCWGSDYKLVAPKEFKQTENNIAINYTDSIIKDTIHIIPGGALTEHIQLTKPTIDRSQQIPVLYPNTDSVMGYDVFSAVFYLLSRAEEYHSDQKDAHGRFLPAASILHELGWLQKPIVEYWIKQLLAVVKATYANFTIQQSEFTYRSTIDVDNAYAFKHKGIRILYSTLKDLATRNFDQLKERIQVITAKVSDPYDTYAFIKQKDTQYKHTTLFFWLLGNYNKFDTNLNSKNSVFRELIQQVSETSDVGIHPSYRSNRSVLTLGHEKKILERMLNMPVTKSRQHYLKLSIPETYRSLLQVGVFEDYSLGYASEIGFRAGTCHPFYFYDLEKEVSTRLKLVSFPIMEVTLQQYKKYTPKEAIQVYSTIISEVKKHGGTFVSLWHNESLSDKGIWKGWRKVYEKMLELVYLTP